MFDIKFIRDNPENFDESMALRKVVPCAEEILKLDLNTTKFIGLALLCYNIF